ncbi:polyketide cyclase/dehydrase/lipid transport protein [Paucimonas lemoignei]|uniref:Polyketide cyclase/dehydrase/lipid transport protein n=1 Tax=Paucimonas lemoignei TaxID=29443 RepID=A0A4R3HYU3_PAULE|nr:SRPBCC family protein [Paucimonas lemoignei]TCS37405.1 polyketide cyclase/dehydrase/lipid transport protein [Paucimonas lemoignei]
MESTLNSAGQAAAPRQAPALYNPPNTPLAPASAQHDEQAFSGVASYGRSAGSARSRPQQRHSSAANLAKGLGWLSIGLGVAQLLAPRAVSRAAGVDEHPMLLRAVGLREIASGAGILSQPRQQGNWLWSRVAGDIMDLALLGVAAQTTSRFHRKRRQRIGMATAIVAGITVLDVMSSMREKREARQSSMSVVQTTKPGEVDVQKSITVNKSPEECYRFWRDFQNFPRFMKHLEEVSVTGDTKSHWRAKAPGGTTVEWDAEITVDHPGELLAWHSLEGADIENAGTVRFERGAGGRGTVIRIDLLYSPPGGKAWSVLAKLFGEEPELQIDQDLRRFKQLMETGEIPTTVGQPSGPRSMITRLLFKQGEPG